MRIKIMETTKKMPVSVSYAEVKVNANEFLVPCPSQNTKLIGIKTGKEYSYGTISYIGKSISIEDIIKKMLDNGIDIVDVSSYKEVLNNYIDQLYTFKISNVITSVLNQRDCKDLVLIKIANRPERE